MKSIKNLTYQSPFHDEEICVVVSMESFWMTQLQMSRLFGCRVQEVHAVLKRLFSNGELDEASANRTIEVPNSRGDYIRGNFYNLDAIIAVGYRLSPRDATHFHIWSTQMLRSHLLESLAPREYSFIGSLKRKFSHMLAAA